MASAKATHTCARCGRAGVAMFMVRPAIGNLAPATDLCTGLVACKRRQRKHAWTK